MGTRMPLLDWGILIVAGSSLIFAYIAYRKVSATTHKIDAILSKVPKNPLKIFTPDFVAETITRTLTKDIQNPDGSPVSMPQFLNGYIQAYGPALKAEFKAELPKLIPLLLNPSPPTGPQNPGQALAQQRWGSGGLNAAKALSKASKKVPFLGKVGEYVEGAQALVGLVPVVRELGQELKGLKGDGNGGQGSSAPAQSDADSDWGPPF